MQGKNKLFPNPSVSQGDELTAEGVESAERRMRMTLSSPVVTCHVAAIRTRSFRARTIGLAESEKCVPGTRV